MKLSYLKWYCVFIISCLGLIIYSQTLNYSFHFDDQVFIIDNFYIRNIHLLLDNWKFYPCRFITLFSIVINYHFNGLNVFGYHLFNITVHLACAVLVWWLILLTLSTPMMKSNKISAHADLIALFVGLVFVSHPVQVESVTYIWQRAASMVTFFYLASLCFYIKSRLLQDSNSHPVRRKIYYVFSLIFAIAAMFTKENSITLPLMVLLYELSFFKSNRGFNGGYSGLFLFTIIIIPLTMFLTKAPQFFMIQKFVKGPEGTSPMQYLFTQFKVISTYIGLIFFPFNQNLDYDYPVSKSFFEIPAMLGFVFLAGILYWAKHLFLKYRLISFAIFWFFLTLIPESSVFPLKNVIFEHRLYLPLVGFSLFLVSGMYYLLGNNGTRSMVIALILILSCYSMLTFQRNEVWRDEITLWNDAVSKSPHKARPYNNRAFAFFSKGDLTHAIADYNKAIELNPKLVDAYVGRGLSFSDRGDFTKAIADYNRAILLEPDFEEAYNNRGIFYLHQNNYFQSILDLNKAIGINPNDSKAYYNRGLSYAKEGDITQAIADYNKAIELDGEDADAYYNRGLSLAQQKLFNQAVHDFIKTIELNPNDADAYNNLGIIYASEGRIKAAISNFKQAIKLDPHDTKALHNLSNAELLKHI